MELLAKIAKPRPVGTSQNWEITNYIESYIGSLGYETNKIPFSCKVWESKESFLVIDGIKLALQVSPYSLPFAGTRKAIVVSNLEELERVECKDKILF